MLVSVFVCYAHGQIVNKDAQTIDIDKGEVINKCNNFRLYFTFESFLHKDLGFLNLLQVTTSLKIFI